MNNHVVDNAFVQAYWLVQRHRLAGFYEQNKEDLTMHWQVLASHLNSHNVSKAGIGTNYNWSDKRLVEGDFGYKDLGDLTEVTESKERYNPNYRRLSCFIEAMQGIVLAEKTWFLAQEEFSDEQKEQIKQFWQPTRRGWYEDKQQFFPCAADGVAPVAIIDTKTLLQNIFEKPQSHKDFLSLAFRF